MKVIIFLILVSIGYYYYHKKYPQPTIHHCYVGGFVGIIVILKYLMSQQKPFMFKMANNIKNANNIHLHELVPEFNNKKNDIKYVLADKQLLRCMSCKNIIDVRYIDEYKLTYQTPLARGGLNDFSNLALICPTCYQISLL